MYKNSQELENSSRGLFSKRKREIFENSKDGIFFLLRSSEDSSLFQEKKDQSKFLKNILKNLLKDNPLKALSLGVSEAFLPNGFTRGIHTTSRAESMNALVKKFCNSESEISDIIKFLKAFGEKKLFSKK